MIGRVVLKTDTSGDQPDGLFLRATPLSRRKLLMSGLMFIASSSIAAAGQGDWLDAVRDKLARQRMRDYSEGLSRTQKRLSLRPKKVEQDYDPELLPPPESEFDYPVEPVDPSLIDSVYRRQLVEFQDFVAPGTIIIDPKEHFLYQALGNRQAMRYGVGVGRAGFAWAGNAEIRMMRRWPRWVPPKEMVARDKRAKKWANGQPGGPDNPLGARALYLYAGGKDTLFRIHGTIEPQSIGKSVSSGCIRMLNEDVADLFDRVMIGTKVIVRA